MAPGTASGRRTAAWQQAWQATAEACPAPPSDARPKGEALGEQWNVLVECRDEKQQVELLSRFNAELLFLAKALEIVGAFFRGSDGRNERARRNAGIQQNMKRIGVDGTLTQTAE